MTGFQLLNKIDKNRNCRQWLFGHLSVFLMSSWSLKLLKQKQKHT